MRTLTVKTKIGSITLIDTGEEHGYSGDYAGFRLYVKRRRQQQTAYFTILALGPGGEPRIEALLRLLPRGLDAGGPYFIHTGSEQLHYLRGSARGLTERQTIALIMRAIEVLSVAVDWDL